MDEKQTNETILKDWYYIPAKSAWVTKPGQVVKEIYFDWEYYQMLPTVYHGKGALLTDLGDGDYYCQVDDTKTVRRVPDAVLMKWLHQYVSVYYATRDALYNNCPRISFRDAQGEVLHKKITLPARSGAAPIGHSTYCRRDFLDFPTWQHLNGIRQFHTAINDYEQKFPFTGINRHYQHSDKRSHHTNRRTTGWKSHRQRHQWQHLDK